MIEARTSKRPNGLAAALALALMATALQGCGSGPSSSMADAETAYNEHSFRTARIHLLNLLDQDPQSAAANLLYAQTMLQLGDGIAAQPALDALSAADIGEDRLRTLQSQAYILRGQAQKAVALMEGATAQQRMASWDAQSYHIYLWALMENETLDDEPELFAEALAIYDTSAAIHALAGRHAVNLGDRDIARKAMENALARDPEDYEALLLKAEVQIYDGDLNGAKATYAALSKRFPDHGVPPSNIAGLEIDAGNYDAAEAIITRTEAQHPKFAFLQFQKARLAHARQDYRRANDILQSMPDYITDYPPGLALAAQVAEKLGNRQIAIARLQRLLAIVPDDDAARAALGQLQ